MKIKIIYSLFFMLLISCNNDQNSSTNNIKKDINELDVIESTNINESVTIDNKQEIEDFGIVTSDHLRVRDQIGTESNIIGKIHSGTIFQILETSEDRYTINNYTDWWYKIRVLNVEELEGWVYGAFTDTVIWSEEANELLDGNTWDKIGNIHKIEGVINESWGTNNDYPWIFTLYNNGIFRGIKAGPGSPRSFGFWRTVSENQIEIEYISAISDNIVNSFQIDGTWSLNTTSINIISNYSLEKSNSDLMLVNYSKRRNAGEEYTYNGIKITIMDSNIYKVINPTIVYTDPSKSIISRIGFEGYYESEYIPSGKHVTSIGNYAQNENIFYLVDLRLDPYNNKGEYLGFINSNDLSLLEKNEREIIQDPQEYLNSIFENVASEETLNKINEYSAECDSLSKQMEEARINGNEDLEKVLNKKRWDIQLEWSEIDPRLGL